jgi:hypothetical protein
MNKIITKPVVTLALLAGVMGVSSVPLGAGAISGDRNYWNNNSRNREDNRWNNNRRETSDRDVRFTAQRHFPNRHIVREDDNRRDNDGRRVHRFVFDDNHCVDVRDDDGVVVRIFIYFES